MASTCLDRHLPRPVDISRLAFAEMAVGTAVLAAFLVTEFVLAGVVLRFGLVVAAILGAIVVAIALRGIPWGRERRRRLLIALSPCVPIFLAAALPVPDALWGLAVGYLTGAMLFEIGNWLRLGRVR